ncbi:MAG: hypothetical protein ACKVQS_04280 [Fimbriimonadaceae bacterium]
MRSVAWILACGLVLVGCNGGGAPAKRSPFSEAEFTKLLGVGEVTSSVWIARDYVSIPPPMDGGLIDALADPFNENAEWMKPEKKAERESMAKSLDEWWSKAKNPALNSLENDLVVSQFSVVVGARVLRARLMDASGDKTGALKIAVETMNLAREGFLSAPGMVCADLMPTVVIAAEGLSRIGQRVGGSEARAAMKAMDFSILDRVASCGKEDFVLNQMGALIEQWNRKDQSAAMAELVDPMGDEDGPIQELDKALKGNTLIKIDSVVDKAKELCSLYSAAPINFDEFATRRNALNERLKKVWGINIFETPANEWDGTAMHDPVEESDNPVGEIYMAAIERGWLTKIESSYVMQMNLDAARIALMESLAAVDGMDGDPDWFGRVIDPLTGKTYEVDYKARIVKTRLKDVDPKYIFVNQIVQNGVPLVY